MLNVLTLGHVMSAVFSADWRIRWWGACGRELCHFLFHGLHRQSTNQHEYGGRCSKAPTFSLLSKAALDQIACRRPSHLGA